MKLKVQTWVLITAATVLLAAGASAAPIMYIEAGGARIDIGGSCAHTPATPADYGPGCQILGVDLMGWDSLLPIAFSSIVGPSAGYAHGYFTTGMHSLIELSGDPDDFGTYTMYSWSGDQTGAINPFIMLGAMIDDAFTDSSWDVDFQYESGTRGLLRVEILGPTQFSDASDYTLTCSSLPEYFVPCILSTFTPIDRVEIRASLHDYGEPVDDNVPGRNAVPEPASLLLVGSGLLGITRLLRRKPA